MDIRRKFLKLTKKTYPYGFEDQLASHLPKGYFKDRWGNYYYKIGNSKTAFTCHLDTACKEQRIVNHRFDKNIISTDGKTILGADDKAGMTVLLYMIEKKVPGLYCFFIGEEVGCIGSGKACDDSVWKYYEKMISFDRRGTKSVITYQSSKRCCSDDFARDLSSQLNLHDLSMEPDDTGVYTDSAEFIHVIPECTNISVGYYKEHTSSEHQDIDHLIKLCIAVTKINWEVLPVKRDPKQVDYKSYSYSSKSYGNYSYDKSWDNSDSSYPSTYDSYYGISKKTRRSNKKFYDDSRGNSYGYENKPGKYYYDSLDNEFSDGYTYYPNTDTHHYGSLKQELHKDFFEKEEALKIKKQYLDLSDEFDSEYVDDFMSQAFDF